jgi:hypothetical protein
MEQISSSRRKFLRYAGLSGLAAAALAACTKTVKNFPGDGKGKSRDINLGSGDMGILNYAYALEQLEAAFYTLVVAAPYENIPSLELSRLTDIRNHEIAHREFFKTALGKDAIPLLLPNFSMVDFSSRDSVLETAQAFEDLGVSAYNGAGSLISNPDYLTLAGKIVSVEARHAAYIRNLVSPGSFADMTVVDSNGLDMHRSPAEVLAIAQSFLVDSLDASGLPTA